MGGRLSQYFWGSFSGIYICINSTLLKNLPANPGDLGSVPGLGRSPTGGNGNPLQYSCLGTPWAGEPDGLQSMELKRVRHDLATEQCRHLLHCFSLWGCVKLSVGPVTSTSSHNIPPLAFRSPKYRTLSFSLARNYPGSQQKFPFSGTFPDLKSPSFLPPFSLKHFVKHREMVYCGWQGK